MGFYTLGSRPVLDLHDYIVKIGLVTVWLPVLYIQSVQYCIILIARIFRWAKFSRNHDQSKYLWVKFLCQVRPTKFNLFLWTCQSTRVLSQPDSFIGSVDLKIFVFYCFMYKYFRGLGYIPCSCWQATRMRKRTEDAVAMYSVVKMFNSSRHR